MPPVTVILGPTAVGKSAVGLRLAEWLGGEIVSADALQAYRGLDIGTAKPTEEERSLVPHHLIDILEPDEAFSAGEFARRARQAIQEIHDRGAVPIVVGGSGLYIRALIDGLSEIPAVDPGLRDKLRRRLRQNGLEPLMEELTELDPEGASRLRPGDTQRVVRALEVVISTGIPLSSWHAERPTVESPLEVSRVGLTLERGVLYDRIAHRVHRMIETGWLGEVEELLSQGLSPSLPAFQAIGYRQLAAHIAGELSLEEAIEETIRGTRRYAKRQLTWFRKESDVSWFSADDLETASRTIRSFLAHQESGVSNGQVDHQHSGRVFVPGPEDQQTGDGSPDDR